MHQRAFVLVPLCDISADKKHPVLHKMIKELVTFVSQEGIVKQHKIIENPKDAIDFEPLRFITIEGNIGAGKTTLSKMIAEDFNAQLILERYADNPFLPKFYENQERYAFPLEMSFLADRYKQIQAALSQVDLFSRRVVSDYYIYKSLLFAQVTLNEDEFELYRSIFDVMNQQIQKPEKYIFLYQNTENLLKNIRKRGRDYEAKIPEDYLSKINQSYAQFIKTLPPDEVLVLDMEERDFVNNHSDYLWVLQQITNR